MRFSLRKGNDMNNCRGIYELLRLFSSQKRQFLARFSRKKKVLCNFEKNVGKMGAMCVIIAYDTIMISLFQGGGIVMICVSRLNGKTFYINPDLIEFVEETPDTVISTTTGKKLVVEESAADVIERVVFYKQKVFLGLPKIIQCNGIEPAEIIAPIE
jgi:flagellar protein FlbD